MVARPLLSGNPSERSRVLYELAKTALVSGQLHYVRKDEMKAYIRQLKRKQSVRCDDGTPLDKLGAD